MARLRHGNSTMASQDDTSVGCTSLFICSFGWLSFPFSISSAAKFFMLFLLSFHSPCGSQLGIHGTVISAWIGVLHQNLTNFYHNAPTRDIRLFMKSFSNEQSPND
ncbi:hypothetical protein OROHE_021228 [Orobanche hederae]